MALASAATAAALIAVVGGGYYLVSTGSESGRIIRLALKDLTESGEIADPQETAEDEEAQAQPDPTPSETDGTPETEASAPPEPEAATGGSAAAQAATLISPGSWEFNTLLFNVTKVDLSDTSFRLSREGIGMSERHAQCISPAIADNPRTIAFPFRASLDCRASSFSMDGGRYRSTMSCYFPQYGGRRPVEVEGRYSATDISVDARVRVPAQVVSGDFEDPPEIHLHYRVTGRRTQPC